MRLLLAVVVSVALGFIVLSLSKNAPGPSDVEVAAAKQHSDLDSVAATLAVARALSADKLLAQAAATNKGAVLAKVAAAHAFAKSAKAAAASSSSKLKALEDSRVAAGASVYFAWYGMIALAFLWLVSTVLAGEWNPFALAMGLDNRLSTSKLQALLWTACVGFVYAMIYADRVVTYGHVEPIGTIPQNVLFALGLSVTSAVGAKAITGSQVATNSSSKDTSAAPSYDPADLVRDDGASAPSLTKVQLLFWTVFGIVVYLTSSFHGLAAIASCPSGCSFPDIDTTLMLFMGLGHATYLGGKLVGSSTPLLSKVTEENDAVGKVLLLAGSGLGSTGTVLINGAALDDSAVQSWTATTIRFRLSDDATGSPWSPGERIAIAVSVNGTVSPAITYVYPKAPVQHAPPAPIRKALTFRAPAPATVSHWGVDTTANVTDELVAGAQSRIRKPDFWGRYLTGFPITADEIALLKGQRIRLLPIYQGTTAHPSLLIGATSGQQGAKDAAAAIAIARDTHRIPTGMGIAIYADIEPQYYVSHYWLTAWIDTMTAAGYLAGIYCGSNQPGIIAGMSGLTGVDPAKVLIWSCMPHDTTKTGRGDVPVSCGAPGFVVGRAVYPVDMWQYCLDCGDYDFNVCSDRAFDAMWQP